MQFHDLGPLWVESAGLPLGLHGKRMEAVLSALLVRLGDVVRADWLIDAVWGENPPPKASAALDTVMWRLRRVLDPDRAARVASTVLRTEEQGYRLTVPPDNVDSKQFAATVGVVSSLDESADAAEILELTGTGLALWRGRPFAGIEDAEWVEPARLELTEHHLTLQRYRISALLAVGQPEQAVSELVPALREHPFVERLWAQRILGLYRAGRPSAALDAYRQARELLDRELGVSPGPELQQLQQRILRHDESLNLPAPQRATATPGPVRIPRRRTSLIGRSKEVAAADRLLSAQELLTITGPIGCGKTRLAIAVAEQVRARFPDGVYFADLSDITDPAAVAHRVCEILGLESDSRSSPNSQIAQFVIGRQLLVVLDNCEQVVGAAAALAESILDADVSAGSISSTRILATSRRPLDVEGEVVLPLRPLELPAGDSNQDLAASPAVALFVERVTGAGGSVDLTGDNGAAVAAICAATDGLPLSIELAAARARTFQLHEVATAISDNPIGLGPAVRSRIRPHDGATLGESIETSHRLLSEDERVAHRRFAVLPPGFTLDAAVAVCAGSLSADRVAAAVTALVHQSLLEAGGPERAGGPTLFRQLVPIRAHAAAQLESVGETVPAHKALEAWVVGMVNDGPLLGHPGQADWYRRLDDNRRTVSTALDHSIAAGPTDDVLLTVGRLVVYWLDRLNSDGMQLARAARAAMGPGNENFARVVTIAAHGSLVAANQETAAVGHELQGVIAELAATGPGDREVAGYALITVGISCWTGDDYELAAVAAQAAGRVAAELGDPHLDVLARAVRCAVRLWSDPASAVSEATAAVADDHGTRNDFAALVFCVVLSIAALLEGDGAAGLRWSSELLRRQDRLGVRSIGDTLETRGNHYVNAGQLVDAVRCYGAAQQQNVRLGRKWPRHPGTPASLQACRDALSLNDFEEAWRSGERLGANDLVQDWL